jgi:type IV secretory pathway VirB10-like protein
MSQSLLGGVMILLVVAGASGCRKKQAAVPPAVPAPQSVPATPADAPPPAPAPRKPPQVQPPRVEPPKPAVVESPRLGALLTPEQQRDQNLRIDRSLAEAGRSLSLLEKRQLSAAQQAAVAQIRGFMEHAEQLRKSDLTGARSLAERAQVLARDLVNSLR